MLILLAGWRFSWLILGLVILFVTFIGMLQLREFKGSTGSSEKIATPVSLRAALKNPFFIALGVIIHFICGFTDVPFSTLWVPISLELGIGEMEASYVLGLIAAMSILGMFIFGLTPKRLGSAVSLASCYALRCIAFLLPMTLQSSQIYTYYAFAALLGLSFSGMMPIISAWFAEIFGAESLGSLYGFSNFIHFVGAAAGIYFFSLIAEVYKTYYFIYPMSVILVIITIVLCLLLKKT
jgi:MFS family permease